MKRSTVPATFFSSSAYASICWIEASTIAWKVPWISEATKIGKSIAFSVARATSPTRPTGPLPAAAGAGAGAGETPGDPGVEGEGDDDPNPDWSAPGASCAR